MSTYARPTMKLRWTEQTRIIDSGPPAQVITDHKLQQWWELQCGISLDWEGNSLDYFGKPVPGEWRDIPFVNQKGEPI